MGVLFLSTFLTYFILLFNLKKTPLVHLIFLSSVASEWTIDFKSLLMMWKKRTAAKRSNVYFKTFSWFTLNKMAMLVCEALPFPHTICCKEYILQEAVVCIEPIKLPIRVHQYVHSEGMYVLSCITFFYPTHPQRT